MVPRNQSGCGKLVIDFVGQPFRPELSFRLEAQSGLSGTNHATEIGIEVIPLILGAYPNRRVEAATVESEFHPVTVRTLALRGALLR